MENNMEEDTVSMDLSLNDVYKIAAEIVAEFENIIDICGAEAVNPIIQKVVRALECLEISITKLGYVEKELMDVKMRWSHLKNEKAAKDEAKLKMEQDLEQIEDSWRHEIKHLKCIVLKLQEENRRLQSLLEDSNYQQTSENIPDQCFIKELKDVIAALNSKLHDKEYLIRKTTSDLDSLKYKIEHLNRANKMLHLRLSETKVEVKHLCEDKSYLQMQIQDQQQMLQTLQGYLREAILQNMDKEEVAAEDEAVVMHHTDDKIKELLQEQDELRARICELEHEFALAKVQKTFERNPLDSSWLKHQKKTNYLFKSCRIHQLFRLFLGEDSSEENFRAFTKERCQMPLSVGSTGRAIFCM